MVMKYPVSFCAASLTDADVLERSTDGYDVALRYGPISTVDTFSGGVIDTALWATANVVEGAFLGKDCLKMTGPATDTWDSSYIIYKPAITPNAGSVVNCKLIANHASVFAVGLQEYDFTVDSVATPTSWTPKASVGAQNPLNSTYVVFEGGVIKIMKGGSSGTIIKKYKNWRISETGNLAPIIVTFAFTLTGYNIYWSQDGASTLLHQEVRSTGTQPTDGYSFVANMYSSEAEVGMYDLNLGFSGSGYVRSSYVEVPDVTTRLQTNTLTMNSTLSYLTGVESGELAVQFPEYSNLWFTTDTIATSAIVMTGQIRHRIDWKMLGDVVFDHQSYVSEVEVSS